MIKLLENSYRVVNIGLIDEIDPAVASVGDERGEVVAAAAIKPFGFQAFYRGRASVGTCIPLDPQFCVAGAAREAKFATRYIVLAE